MGKHKFKKIAICFIFIIASLMLITNFGWVSADMDDEYKKTEDLTSSDKFDEYQKNYQENVNPDGSYMKKSVEWVDKESGEALITIKLLHFLYLPIQRFF